MFLELREAWLLGSSDTSAFDHMTMSEPETKNHFLKNM